MSNFKTEIYNNYCTINPGGSCFTRLLNGEKSLFNKQEKNIKM